MDRKAGTNSGDWLSYVRFYLRQVSRLSKLNFAGNDYGQSVETYAKLPLWSRLVHLFYAYFTLKLFMCLIFQHDYNNIKNELSTLDGALHTQNISSSSRRSLESRQLKQAQLDAAVARLNFVGNGAYQSGHIAELVFVFLLLMFFMSYVEPHLYITAIGPLKINLLQMLIDAERFDKQVTSRQIEQQASEFILSSRNFSLARSESVYAGFHSAALLGRNDYVHHGTNTVTFARSQDHLGQQHQQQQQQQQQQQKQQQQDQRTLQRAQLYDISFEHAQVVVAVRSMARKGELRPLNRRPASVEPLARLYGAMIVLFYLLVISLAMCLIVVLPLMGVLRLTQTFAPRDLLFYLEFMCYGLLGGWVVSYHIILMIMTAYDHIGYVLELRRMIADMMKDMMGDEAHLFCVSREPFSSEMKVRPKTELAHLRAAPCCTGAVAELTLSRKPLEKNARALIRVLILYKLFNRQLSSTQPFIGLIGAHVAATMIMVPFIARFYVAFFSLETRLVILVIALGVIAMCEVMVMPHCWLNARCLDLFKALFRLLTCIDAQTHGRQCTHRAALGYDAHTVWLLRRELNLPERAVRRFATNAIFLELTFASFLSVHFWCGLLLAPLLIGETLRPDSSDSTFASVMRLF